MNTYQNSEICQKCAKCCKMFWFFTEDKDDAIRASWLDTDIVHVIKIKEGLWKIGFDIPCKMLEEKEGIYSCKQYNGLRPGYCKSYPNNFNNDEKEVIENESKTCPIIKKVLKGE